MSPIVRVLGCGRWSLGDDAAGLEVAQLLRERDLPLTEVTSTEDPCSTLTIDDSKNLELVALVDAAPADAHHPAGTFERLDYRQCHTLRHAESLESTHTLGVAAGLEVADALGLLPETVWLYLIFGERFELRFETGRRVRRGLKHLADRIERDIRQWLESHTCTSCR